ncbi:hypothetical protein [Rhizobium rhizogenes]|uniref:hypothetical protein n=1 Tax=Rhizobium rhizogenes TaxID=359 RepID=UPI001F2166AA|nr:hypothetical protein [Rhizobium rhizogenes]
MGDRPQSPTMKMIAGNTGMALAMPEFCRTQLGMHELQATDIRRSASSRRNRFNRFFSGKRPAVGLLPAELLLAAQIPHGTC